MVLIIKESIKILRNPMMKEVLMQSHIMYLQIVPMIKMDLTMKEYIKLLENLIMKRGGMFME